MRTVAFRWWRTIDESVLVWDVGLGGLSLNDFGHKHRTHAAQN